MACAKQDTQSNDSTVKATAPAEAPSMAKTTEATPSQAKPIEKVEEKAKVKEMEVQALSGLVGNKAVVTIYDANSPEARTKEGIIPGAKMLSDVKSYPLTELPQDKSEKLVFYCYNEQCPASHKAAEKAIIAGHSDVHILPAGIMGWKKAGYPTTSVQ